MKSYQELAKEIGDLVTEKQKSYGNSFDQAGDFLKLLYPDGIPVDAYTDALCIVRIFDKLKRLGNASNLPVNEGKVDAWKDIVGYGLLGLHKDTVSVEEPVNEDKKEFEEKKAEEQGYYRLNTIMADRAKAEHEELQKEKMKKMIEESRLSAQQKLENNVEEPPASVEEIKKKDEADQEKMIKAKCRICGYQVDQMVSEAEINAGKIVVHADCYSKWQREQKLKEEKAQP